LSSIAPGAKNAVQPEIKRLRSSVLALAAMALAACAAHRTTPAPVVVVDTHVAQPTTPVPSTKTPPSKPRAKVSTPVPVVAVHSDAIAAEDVGYYLDVLQGRLRQESSGKLTPQRQGNRIVLDISRDVAFAPRGADVDAGYPERLAPLAKVLAEYKSTTISVQVREEAGDTAKPTLADQRSHAVMKCLIQAGVPATRVSAISTAGSDVSGDDAAGAHVQIVLEPLVRP
jgi:outer membrane protein OmpA-like peptidoglycan-associated protein